MPLILLLVVMLMSCEPSHNDKPYNDIVCSNNIRSAYQRAQNEALRLLLKCVDDGISTAACHELMGRLMRENYERTTNGE
jgi:hypothetical protein